MSVLTKIKNLATRRPVYEEHVYDPAKCEEWCDPGLLDCSNCDPSQWMNY